MTKKNIISEKFTFFDAKFPVIAQWFPEFKNDLPLLFSVRKTGSGFLFSLAMPW